MASWRETVGWVWLRLRCWVARASRLHRPEKELLCEIEFDANPPIRTHSIRGRALAAQTAADGRRCASWRGWRSCVSMSPGRNPAGALRCGCACASVERRAGVAFSPGAQYRQVSFVPNLVLDLREPDGPATPYLIGGVGSLHRLEKSIHYRSGGTAWNGGVGVRIRAGTRAFVAPEFRLGYVSRLVVSAGYRSTPQATPLGRSTGELVCAATRARRSGGREGAWPLRGWWMGRLGPGTV